MIQREGKLSFVLLAGAASLVLPVDSHLARATDLDTVAGRITDQLIATDPSDSTVEGYMSSLQSNGSWSDVNYSNTAQTNWTPATALTRMLDMAESYSNSSSSLDGSTTLEADILKAYDYWISVDPQSTNWYDNDIRTPQGISSTMVLMKSKMSATELSEGNTILNRADAELSVPSIATGSNLVLLATVGINQGVVDGSTADVSQGFQEIQSTVQVVSPGPGEGIEPDSTYQFHGPQLYIGDYGTTALTDPLQYASIAAGTSFAMGSAQEQILVNALLDGSQWFVYGQSLDFSASGRDASRQGFNTDGTNFVSAIDYALSLGNYRFGELQAFLNRQEAAISSGSASSSLGLTGNKDFFDSDMMVQQRPGYFESAKVTSIRTVNPESINGENLKGLYLADGVNEIMVTGNEYNNIEPVWNWRRLPGTTVEQNTRSLQPGSADKGSTSFAGGVSDGMYGAEALAYNRFDVAAEKSWFFFDHEEVALGAAINAPNATSEVDTTLNQCLLTSTVSYETTGSSSPQTLTSGSVSPTGLQWVYQGGVGYLFLTPVNNATIQAMAQSGTWQSINSQYSSSTVSENVFTLYLNHGAHTSNGSYSYIVVPNTTVAGMEAYAASDPVQILSNDANVQAVQQTALDIMQASFYAPDSFSIVPGQTLAANGASAVMLQRQPDVLKLAASSPQNLQMSLQLQLNGVTLSGSSPSWFDAMGNSTVNFNLPGGSLAGSTIGLTLQSDGDTTPIVSLSNSTGSMPLSFNVTAPVMLPTNTTFQTDANSTLTFSAPVGGVASFTSAGTGTLVLSAVNTYTRGTNISGGTLVVGVNGALPDGAVDITAGTLKLASSIGLAQITSLAIFGSGQLDITNNHVIINYGGGPDPIASIEALIVSGFALGAWNGAGIMSTNAQTNGGSYGIGYADSADPGNPAGLASGQIEIMYTLLGDANLDGKVNGTDFNILAANFNTGGDSWDQGDFTYDGKVNGSDFNLLAANFNQGASQSAVGSANLAALDSFASANGLLTEVPEPASAGVLVMAGLGVLHRRRRR